MFAEILDSMPNLTYCTTWSEAQQMLLDNPRFTDDPDLHSKYQNTGAIIIRFCLISQYSPSCVQ